MVVAFLRQVEYFRGIMFLATNKRAKLFDAAVLGRIDIIYRYDCSNIQQKIHMWKFHLLRRGIHTEDASSIAAVLGERYPELDYRVVQKVVKLGQLLASSKGVDLGLETMEEALVLHRGSPSADGAVRVEDEPPTTACK